MKTSVLLATFDELEPARMLLEKIQLAGLEASLNDESEIERYWFSAPTLAAIHVMVVRDDYVAAKRLMQELDASEGALQEAVRCPECHSPRVEFPHLTRKFVTPRLLSLIFPRKFMPDQFYCMDCQYTWPNEVPVERKRDVLGWPADSRLWHPETVKPSGSGTH